MSYCVLNIHKVCVLKCILCVHGFIHTNTRLVFYLSLIVDVVATDCRNVDNIPRLASSSYVTHTVSMATVVLSKVSAYQIFSWSFEVQWNSSWTTTLVNDHPLFTTVFSLMDCSINNPSSTTTRQTRPATMAIWLLPPTNDHPIDGQHNF